MIKLIVFEISYLIKIELFNPTSYKGENKVADVFLRPDYDGPNKMSDFLTVSEIREIKVAISKTAPTILLKNFILTNFEVLISNF